MCQLYNGFMDVKHTIDQLKTGIERNIKRRKQFLVLGIVLISLFIVSIVGIIVWGVFLFSDMKNFINASISVYGKYDPNELFSRYGVQFYLWIVSVVFSFSFLASGIALLVLRNAVYKKSIERKQKLIKGITSENK